MIASVIDSESESVIVVEKIRVTLSVRYTISERVRVAAIIRVIESDKAKESDKDFGTFLIHVMLSVIDNESDKDTVIADMTLNMSVIVIVSVRDLTDAWILVTAVRDGQRVSLGVTGHVSYFCDCVCDGYRVCQSTGDVLCFCNRV